MTDEVPETNAPEWIFPGRLPAGEVFMIGGETGRTAKALTFADTMRRRDDIASAVLTWRSPNGVDHAYFAGRPCITCGRATVPTPAIGHGYEDDD
jgi:hypothetical protein